jgi:hypothetical protein
MASSAQLERRAERARERLTDRIADLRYHVSPATVVGDLIGVNPSTLGDEILPLIAKQARNGGCRNTKQMSAGGERFTSGSGSPPALIRTSSLSFVRFVPIRPVAGR